MLSLTSLVEIFFDVYITVLLLRVWMRMTRCDFYNPFSQFIVKVTQPILKPLSYMIPATGAIDNTALFLAWLLNTIKYPLLIMLQVGIFSISPWYLLLGLLLLIKSAGSLLFWVIVIRSIMSWVSQGNNPIDYILFRLTEPLMSLVRRYLPTMGGLDFSGMIIVIALYFLNNPVILAMDMVTKMMLLS